MHRPPTITCSSLCRWLLIAIALGFAGAASAQNVQFRQTSVPALIVDQTAFPLPGAAVSTVTAPDTSGAYKFTSWSVNGVRFADPSGYATNPVTFVINASTDAVANYILAADDSDSDGLPDWWELRYFGNLAQGASGNPDGDADDNAKEYARGTSPVVAYELSAGGISRRRSNVFEVGDVAGVPNDLSYAYGGVSRRRSPLLTMVQNTANYAVLQESSSVTGAISQMRVVAKGSTVSLTSPPDPYLGYRYTGWFINEIRFDRPAQTQPIPITVLADTSIVARYILETTDSDGDGIPDWQEWFRFESLQYDLNSDPDGDGFSLAVETSRGYSQLAPDELAMGGISRRRSATVPMHISGRLPYRLASDPATLLEQTDYLPTGSLVTVPDKNGNTFASYKFSWWDLNGVRQEDPSGAALTGFQFTLSVPSTATAHYIDPSLDTVSDGITDWTKMNYYGSLVFGAASDTDGDGFTFAQELTRGYSPRVVDTLAQGGVSRRRGFITPMNLSLTNQPPALGIGSAGNITQTSARLTAQVNPANLATGVYVEWGLTNSYGQQTSVQNIGSGSLALPVNADVGGLTADTLYHFRLVASNTQGTATGEDRTFRTLQTIVPIDPPVIFSAPGATGTSGIAFGYQITATNNTTSYGATGLPGGVGINPASGLISGIPLASGTFTVTITAANGGGLDSRTLTLTILPPAPAITSVLAALGSQGVAFSYQITATSSPASFGAAGLPAGLSLNTATGLISGTPSVSGSFNVAITASNGSGTGSSVLTLNLPPPAPAITSALAASGTNGNGFSYQITASNNPASYGATGLPAGLSVNPTSGLISGTPITTGTFQIVISAVNPGGTGSSTLVLAILPPHLVDLQVASVTVDPATGIQSGADIVIHWTDSNTGNSPVVGSFNDLVTVRNVTTGAVLLNQSLFYDQNALGNGPIAAADSRSRQVAMRLPDGTAGVGNLEFTVTVDSTFQILEYATGASAEGNNTAQITRTSTLAPYPDLQITGMTVQPSPGLGIESGSTVTIQWSDSNNGAAAVSGSFQDRVRVFNTSSAQTLTDTTVFYDPALVGNGVIAVGNAKTRSFNLTLPNGQPGVGDLQITITADSGNTVFENNATSTGEGNNIGTLTVHATAETRGPVLSNWKYGGATFNEGLTVTQSAVIGVNASDVSGVSRVDFYSRPAAGGTDTLIGTASSGASSYEAYWNAGLTAADGDFIITLKAYDTLGNVTAEARGVHLALAPPPVPVITAPANGSTVAAVDILIRGSGSPGAQVAIYRDGVLQPPLVTVLSDGSFTKTLSLADGPNFVQAAMRNRGGEGLRAAVNITRDGAIPGTPIAVQAAAQANGAIQLSWTRPAGSIAGYQIYRSSNSFDEIAQATRINATVFTGTVLNDTPPADGVYYYRLITVNAAGTESAPSALVSAASDRIVPLATSIEYVSQGKYDAATGRFGAGLVNVVLNVSEPLGSIPFLSITPQGGIPIALALQAGGDFRYTGSFAIASSTPAGTATAVISMRDLAGNRGVGVTTGATITIDTAGPRIVDLAILPSPSIKNDPSAPKTVTLTAQFDTPVKAGTTPQFFYALSNTAPTPIAVTSITQGTNNLTWILTIALSATAGQTTENLALSFSAADDLDNAGSTIVPPHNFQVYQGDLPGLDSPLSLTARSKPAGQVELNWRSVEGAANYQIFRRTTGGGAFAAISLSGGALTVTDLPLNDGVYDYAVAAIRTENGETSVGMKSNVAAAASDRLPPPAPFNLALQVISQGIKAQWLPPAGVSENIVYRVYRSAGNGLDPQIAADGVAQLLAIDPSPGPAHPSYYVTAIDNAGNESQPSNRAYQNVALLPVRTLEVSQVDTSAPVAVWSQLSGGIAGYDIYQGAEGQRTKLNTQGLLTATSFTDTGYSPAADRIYTVVTVDNNQAESLGRSLTLPRISAALPAGTIIKRGVMNRLNFSVKNDSATAVSHAKMRVILGGQEHISPVFSVPANGTVTVPVIVGGYAALLGDDAPIKVTIEIIPNDGEKVTIVRNTSVPLGLGQLQVDVIPGDFLQGGSGKVQFRVANTSDEEIEITTGTANGSQPSPEVRFTLFDTDGNVLATEPFKMVTGTVVVTLPNGRSVVRLPAGFELVSPETSIAVPLSAPENLVVRLEIDNIYYHQGQADQVVLTGLQTRKNIIAAQTTYTAAVTSVSPAESNGDQDIVIAGQAAARAGGQAVPNARVLVYISNDGFERNAEVLTDASGNFAYTFHPSAGEGGGIYNTWAVHPDLTARQVQKTFVIRRVLVSPREGGLRTPRNYSQPVTFSAATGDGVTVHNLQLQYLAEDQIGGTLPAGVTVQLPAAIALLGPKQSAALTASISGTTDAALRSDVVLRVISDESNTGGWQKVTIHVEFGEASPFLRTTPGFVTTGVNPGGSVTETVNFENAGLAAAQDLTFSILNQNGSIAPNWVSLTTSAAAELAVGAKRPVGVVLQPLASVVEGDYFFILRARAANVSSYDVNVHVAVTAQGQGGVAFKVRDPFTGTLDANGSIIEGLQNARIELQNEQVVSVQQTLTTDSFGEAIASNLPAGAYKYRVNADKHVTASGRLWIRPGATVNQDVAMQYNPVTVEFEVVPITIQDRYNIVLQATFETHVPAPVIVVDPPAVNLPRMCKGDVFNGEFTVTNYGLIRADNIKVPVPQSDALFKVELLGGAPTELGAGEVMRVAYRMTALDNFGGNCATAATAGNPAPGQSIAVIHPGVLSAGEESFPGMAPGQPLTLASIGDGGPCISYASRITVTYHYECSNGLEFNGTSQYVIAGRFGNCGSTGSGGWGSWGGGGGGGGGSDGGGGVSYSPIGNSDGEECWGWEIVEISTRTWNDKDPTQNSVGCSVDSMTRRYQDDIRDLDIPIPGRSGASISIDRRLRGTQWSMLDNLVPVFEGLPVIALSSGNVLYLGDSIIKLRRVRGGSQLSALLALPSIQQLLVSQFYWKGVRVDKPLKGITFARLLDGEHKITEADGRWTRFDRYQNIAATGRNDITYTTAVFDAQHRPIQITDGQRVLLTYEWIGVPGSAANPSLISALQDVTGRRVEYTYQGSRLIKVKDVGGKESLYQYDTEGRITKATDTTGKSHLISYSNDAVRSVLDDDGRGKFFEFNTNSGTGEYHTAIRSTSGSVEEKTFDKIGQLTEWKINGLLKEKRVYEGATAVVITDENSRTWREEYDEWRLLKRRVNPDGTSVSFTYDSSTHLPTRVMNEKGIITTLAYDSRRNVTQIVEAAGTPAERTVQYAYDAADRPTSVIWAADTNTAASTLTLAYNVQGNLLQVTDPLNKVREIVSRTGLNSVASMKDANGNTWQFSYDSRNRVNAVTDPDTRVTQLAFDEFNNLTAVTAPSSRKAEFGYDINNSLVSVVDPAGKSHINKYDAGGRLTKSSDRSARSVSYEYDSFDRLVKGFDEQGNELLYSYPQGSASTDPVKITFPAFTRTLTYNFRHQPLTVTDTLPGNAAHTTAYTYSTTGALLAVVDAENHQSTFVRDALDRMTSITRVGIGTSSFTYDDRDHVIAFTNPNGKVWSYAYDLSGRLTQETTPLGKQTKFAYDNLGSLTLITRPDGSKTERGFDARGRVILVKEYAPETAVPAKTVTYGRDEDGRITSYNDGTTSGAYVYNTVGRLATETINYGSFSNTVAYAYEANGQLKSYTSPSGAVSTYSYDSANRLTGTSVTGVGEFAVNSYQFNAITGMTLPGGTKKSYTRDAYARPTQIKSSDPSNTTVLDLTLGYSPVGNVTSRKEGTATVALQYDAANRLRQGVSSKYTYDANGNRLTDFTAGGGTWQYDFDDRLTSDGRSTCAYNENGALIRKVTPVRTWDFSYDYAGRLAGIISDSDVIQYRYDPSGRRISKIVNGVVTYYRHCAFGLCAEYNAAGNLIREYGYSAAASFGAAPLYVRTGGQVYFYHADQLGTPLKLTDLTGAVVWAATYDDFGKATVTTNQVENNFRFPGQYFDAESGLHYNWNRMYDPETGRYLSLDPARSGSNCFTYAGNNPFACLDPNGLRTLAEFGKGLGEGLVGGFVGGLAIGALAAVSAPAAIIVGGALGAYALYEWSQNDFAITPRGLGQVVGGAVGGGLANGLAPSLFGGTPASAAEAPFAFRGDSRPPSTIFNEGFNARGSSTDLFSHALDNNNPASVFVSTSRSADVAAGFADNVYVVRSQGGIDVNQALGSRSPFPNELEIAIPGGIKPGDIRAVTIPSQGVSILNPNWRP